MRGKPATGVRLQREVLGTLLCLPLTWRFVTNEEPVVPHGSQEACAFDESTVAWMLPVAQETSTLAICACALQAVRVLDTTVACTVTPPTVTGPTFTAEVFGGPNVVSKPAAGMMTRKPYASVWHT